MSRPLRSLARADTRARRVSLALALYLLCTVVYFAAASRETLTEHTKFNHYALLADAWSHGRLDLGHPPPAYTQNNDFAPYLGRWYVSFPPFPAVLLLPWAKLAGTPENLRDGQVWLWLAGLGPSVLFLALEKLRRMGVSRRTERTNGLLAATFAFGTVYFFTAEQGTVWFSAHVVAVALSALYLLFALDAERPVLSGAMVGLLFATRPPMLFAGVFFAAEALRVSLRPPPSGAPQSGLGAVIGLSRRVEIGALAKRLALFALPIALILAITFAHNRARFGSAMEFGHHLLSIGWRGRIDKWGLFSYHYLARNLGIVLSSLPFWNKTPPWIQVNSHGLALWITTPLYLWLLWPRTTGWLWGGLLSAVAPIAFADLLYQNSGWLQFGYRFSNDYAVFLFAMLAIAGVRFGRRFWACAGLAVAINAIGALTFERRGFERFYFTDGSQQIIYQPD